MKLWRIASKTRSRLANDLSGTGAALFPGRWNTYQQPVLYCSPSIALAVLETAAHINDAGLPLNRFLVSIDVPAAVWAQHEVADIAKLPKGWSSIPAGQTSAKFGSDWLTSQRSPILLVPSVIVPEECVALINPLHPAASKISAQVVRPFEYSALFRSGQGKQG
ncbi:RES family NAD+ phosphorylase [Limnobacter humi]|uniref:RES family NAD+ phosphorylase n=1 Tax=Limnobacter humi TaxID=1778671 RepID=A0ABT1WIU4_9BURK|nr:RES family NAD+ phosphorylase [Limnobacter humi]